MTTSGTQFNIPIAKPGTTGEELGLIEQVLKSGWVSMGPLTQQFEQAVCDYTGARHAVAVNSCTSAIHLAMLAHGIGAGHQVICPSFSFIATANGIRHAGATPVFADIGPGSLNLCPQAVEALIQRDYTPDGTHRQTGERLKGILLVHQLGLPADIDAFSAIAQKHGLTLIEDNACGLGSIYKNTPLGGSGLTSTLSFHPRKVITTGEGGMLLTNDAEIAEKARVLRAHGMSVSDYVRHNASATLYEQYEVVGYNYRLTDLQSAIGIHQMQKLDGFIAHRIDIAAQYNAAFSELPGISVIQPSEEVTRWNYQSYPIRLDTDNQAQRDALMQALQAMGVTTRRGIPPIHLEPVYASGLTLPETESASRSMCILPIFPTLRDEEVAHVITAVRQCVKQVLG